MQSYAPQSMQLDCVPASGQRLEGVSIYLPEISARPKCHFLIIQIDSRLLKTVKEKCLMTELRVGIANVIDRISMCNF